MTKLKLKFYKYVIKTLVHIWIDVRKAKGPNFGIIKEGKKLTKEMDDKLEEVKQ